MSFTKEQLREQMLLYAVTDRHWLNGQTLYEQVEEALKGGATFIQLREKDLKPGRRVFRRGKKDTTVMQKI